MYIVFILKCQKTLNYCKIVNKEHKQGRSNRLYVVSSVKSRLYCHPVFSSLNQVPEKLYLGTVYNKQLSSQCNLTVQIEPVQDHVIEPVQDHMIEPVPDHVVEPVQDHVVEPVQDHVVEPVQDHVDHVV